MVAGESVWVGTVYGRAFPRFWAAVEPCDVKCGPDFHASSPACRRCQPLGAQEGQQFERLAGDNMEPVPVCQARGQALRVRQVLLIHAAPSRNS